MRVETGKFSWALLVFATLIAIDVLVGLRAVERLVRHRGEVSPDAPFFLLLLLVLQVALLIVADQWTKTLHRHERLREAHEHELELSRQIMENVDSAIVVVDLDGRYVYVNRACSELLGTPVETILGQTSDRFMVFPPGVPPAALWSMSLNEPTLFPVTLRTSGGKMLNVTVKASPRWYGGRVVGAIASVVPEEQVPHLKFPVVHVPR